MKTHSILLASEAQTQELGEALAALTPNWKQGDAPLCVYLSGELGAGKSTLSRAWLRALGVKGAIKSPTYALIEPYNLPDGALLHLDLYRLSAVSELEYLGLDAYLSQARLVLIEWPERGAERLLPPDLRITLSHTENDQRQCRISGESERGALILQRLNRRSPEHAQPD
jgi:tRNA threonylcarbamoyladenosine biosynthesis protein TsaE